jgi:hypothetical protein
MMALHTRGRVATGALEWPDIWTTDPTDYARPIAFDPKERSWRRDDDSRWPNWDKQNRVRQFCST